MSAVVAVERRTQPQHQEQEQQQQQQQRQQHQQEEEEEEEEEVHQDFAINNVAQRNQVLVQEQHRAWTMRAHGESSKPSNKHHHDEAGSRNRGRGSASSFLFRLLCSSFDAMHHGAPSPSSSPSPPESPSPSPSPATATAPTSAEADLRRELMRCAECVDAGDGARADTLITALCRRADPSGDATDRVVAHFTRALALRRLPPPPSPSPSPSLAGAAAAARARDMEVEAEAYLCMNQITPFLRFCHLTANQAILDAVDPGAAVIHVVDVAILQGVQWPPFMQALAGRRGGPPALLRISAAGPDIDGLRRTGRRLHRFAATLGLPFDFVPLPTNDLRALPPMLLAPPSSSSSSYSSCPRGEQLAINCVLRLHNEAARATLAAFLEAVRALRPAVVALAEREAAEYDDDDDDDEDDDDEEAVPPFLVRFRAALGHYSTLFESLEATVPPKSGQRAQVESVCFGREIADIVAREGKDRRHRHRRFTWWANLMSSCGFRRLPLSEFSLSQARLLLRLHYPSEGYQLHHDVSVISSTSSSSSNNNNNCIFLGWQSTPLFFVSSWH